LAQARIVPRGDPGGTETVHVVQADAELDFAIAQYVGVRSAAGRIFAQAIT
jgi:hypothetical protein